MSFNRRILPPVDQLKQMRERINDDEKFMHEIKHKADALEGSSESFDFIRTVEEEMKSMIHIKNGTESTKN